MENEFDCNQRVGILIDSANVFMACRSMGVRLDYAKLLERLNGRQLLRGIVYHVEVDRAREEGFVRKVRSMGYEFKTKKLKKYRNGKAKADMDVDLTVDAISLAEKVDVITIVSGDGDYCPLIHYLKSRGVKTEAMGFEHNTSRDLKKAVDCFIPIKADLMLGDQSNGFSGTA